jgi:hypothetical protein
LETYDNNYAKIQKLMMWFNGVMLHHLLKLGILAGKSFVCYSYALCLLMHLMPPYTPHITPPKKRTMK